MMRRRGRHFLSLSRPSPVRCSLRWYFLGWHFLSLSRPGWR